MKRRKILVLCVCVCLLTVSVNAMHFTDLDGSEWYYADVRDVYQRGLINGKTETTFEADDYLTYAEAAKLAAFMRQQYLFGASNLVNGDPWYQPYVDYCKREKIIEKDYAWNQPATRADYMEIFSKALPDRALPAVNPVADNAIPDVPSTHPQAEAIYKLYRAGILQGSDEFHNCLPDSNIRRSEVAAILIRMMSVEKRISFSMDAAAIRVTIPVGTLSFPEGNSASTTATVSGGKAPYRYLWLRAEGEGPFEETDQTQAEVFIEGAAGVQYWKCRVTDADGNQAESPVFTVEITATAKQEQPAVSGFSIKTQPKSRTVNYLEETVLTIEVSGGTEPYAYQWQVYSAAGGKWVNLSSGVSASLPLQVRSGASYRCVVTDQTGRRVVSETAVLSVARSS